MKLLDVYPWEFPGKHMEGHDKWRESKNTKLREGICDNNFMIYIRRTLEFCLDKGIRAQMDAFKGKADLWELGLLG